jgi:hypothetical protein
MRQALTHLVAEYLVPSMTGQPACRLYTSFFWAAPSKGPWRFDITVLDLVKKINYTG